MHCTLGRSFPLNASWSQVWDFCHGFQQSTYHCDKTLKQECLQYIIQFTCHSAGQWGWAGRWGTGCVRAELLVGGGVQLGILWGRTLKLPNFSQFQGTREVAPGCVFETEINEKNETEHLCASEESLLMPFHFLTETKQCLVDMQVDWLSFFMLACFCFCCTAQMHGQTCS